MTRARSLLFAVLPLFAGCQLFEVYNPAPPPIPAQRLQGQLSLEQDRLILTPCGELRRIALVKEGSEDTLRDARNLLDDRGESLFVDLRGRPQGSKRADLDGELHLEQVYRLQNEGPGCEDPGFDRLLLRASGHEPDWSLGVSEPGLVLLRPGQPPLAVPYLEEQLPGGSSSLSSEANGQRLELWLTPQHCVDDMSGTIQHLGAELRLNDEVLRGCASFGGARSR